MYTRCQVQEPDNQEVRNALVAIRLELRNQKELTEKETGNTANTTTTTVLTQEEVADSTVKFGSFQVIEINAEEETTDERYAKIHKAVSDLSTKRVNKSILKDNSSSVASQGPAEIDDMDLPKYSKLKCIEKISSSKTAATKPQDAALATTPAVPFKKTLSVKESNTKWEESNYDPEEKLENTEQHSVGNHSLPKKPPKKSSLKKSKSVAFRTVEDET